MTFLNGTFKILFFHNILNFLLDFFSRKFLLLKKNFLSCFFGKLKNTNNFFYIFMPLPFSLQSTPPDVISNNSPMMNFPTASLLARSDWWMWKIAWFSRFSFDFEQIQFSKLCLFWINSLSAVGKQSKKKMLMKFPNQWKFVQSLYHKLLFLKAFKPFPLRLLTRDAKISLAKSNKTDKSSMSTSVTFEISSSLTQPVYWRTFGSLITSPEHPRSRFPTIKNLWVWRLEVY